MEFITRLTDYLAKEQGGGVILLGIIIAMEAAAMAFLVLIWRLERKERQDAWLRRNEDMAKLVDVLHEHTTLLTILKTILDRPRR